VPLGERMFDLGLGLLGIGAGAILVIGARRGWRWLVDPPEGLCLLYSQSFIKVVAGTKFLRIWTCVLGVACMAISALYLGAVILELVDHAR
jgi:hypothetical protein